MIPNANSRKPPFASAETLFSMGQPPGSAFTPQHSIHKIMPFEQFRRLDPDTKNSEILRLLPLLTPFANDFVGLRHKIAKAFSQLEDIENAKRNLLHNHNNNNNINNTINNINNNSLFSFPGDDASSYSYASPQIQEQPIPDPFIISKSRILNKRVTLNVGGVRHEVLWKMLEQIPNSRLGLLSKARTHQHIMKLCSDYSLVDNEFFFDRHPRSFNTILNFYRTGKLHVSDEMCVLAFGDDLEFWMINECYMETCCSEKFFTKRDLVVEEMEETTIKLEKDDEEDFGTGKFAKYQKMMWDLIEKPDTSRAAQIISVLSTVFVAISIVGMTISTLPVLQYKDVQGNAIDNPSLAMVETVCIAWFTLEYFIRLAGAPEKWVFLKDGMNIVDVLAIMPFFVSLFFMGPTSKIVTDSMTTIAPEEEEEESSGVEDILQVFRIFKLARVLKLARHSPGLQAIAYTLQNSYKELGLLIFLVCISGFIFASLCYFIEIDQDSGFTSIPTAFYWVVITMTTVGYGDIFPVTGLGKLVGTMCAISGVLVLSLPIPIIAGNFEAFHKNQQKKDKAEKSKKKLKAAKIAEFENRFSFCNSKIGSGENSSCPNKSPDTYSPTDHLLGRTKTWHGNQKIKRKQIQSPLLSPDMNC